MPNAEYAIRNQTKYQNFEPKRNDIDGNLNETQEKSKNGSRGYLIYVFKKSLVNEIGGEIPQNMNNTKRTTNEDKIRNVIKILKIVSYNI